MCTYNGEKYLREQLESIARQTLLPNELVVCDDCSSDETVEIIQDFSRNAPFSVRLMINENNLGFAKNFEKAITLCSGEIIVLSDQDDKWDTGKIECIARAFEENLHAALVFSDAEIVDESLKTLGYRLWQSIGFGRSEQRLVENGRAFEVLVKRNVVTGATMAFRAEFRPVVLPIPNGWFHDAWIALLLSALAEITMIPKPLIRYRQHASHQAGALKAPIAKALETAQNYSVDYYLATADRFQTAYECFSSISCVGDSEKYRSILNEKIKHWKHRAQVTAKASPRTMLVIRELLTGRYFLYSNGWKSIFKDLVLNR